MLKFKPTFLKENGKQKFAVLTIEDYAAVRQALEDAEDARILEEAIRRDNGGPRIPFAEFKRQLAAHRRAKSKKRSEKNSRRKAVVA